MLTANSANVGRTGLTAPAESPPAHGDAAPVSQGRRVALGEAAAPRHCNPGDAPMPRPTASWVRAIPSVALEATPAPAKREDVAAPPRPASPWVSARPGAPAPERKLDTATADRLKSLVDDSIATRKEAAGGLKKGTADKLLSQTANARQGIVTIFASEGKLARMTQEQAQKRINELPLYQLSNEGRRLATELFRAADENLRLLGAAAEAADPSKRLFGDDVRNAISADGAARTRTHFEKPARDLFQAQMQHLIPDSLVEKRLHRNLRGDEARLQMNQLAWEVASFVKNNPDVKIALGSGVLFADDNARMAYLTEFVDGLRLNTYDKFTMREMLADALEAGLPTAGTVETLDALGEGGFGKVSGASWQGQSVARKELKATAEFDVTLQELTIHGQFPYEASIPKLIGTYSQDGTRNIVTERVAGHDVDKFLAGLKATEGLGTPENRARVVLHLLDGTVRGLIAMHEKGLTHRDIKPGNTMVDRNRLEGRLIDFGTAGSQETDAEEGLGSPAYRSPEHRNANMPPAGDIFSLGSSLFEQMGGKLWPNVDPKEEKPWTIPNLLDAGKKPGAFDNQDIWTEQMKPLQDLIEACWEKDPNERPTAAQMVQALNGGPVVPAAPGEAGLKGERVALLDVLNPGSEKSSEFRGGQDLLADLFRKRDEQAQSGTTPGA